MANAGVFMKKVSCASLAGCIWGWIRVSKFQNPLSTKLFVGISAKPIWRKISRNCWRTLSSGWTHPPLGGAPAPGTRLYCLNSASRQLPSCSISLVRSAAAFFRSSANLAPLPIVNVFHVSCFTSLRFLTSASSSLGGTDATSPALIAARYFRAVSSTASAFRTTIGTSPFSIASHFCCIACLKPMSDIVLSSFLKSARGTPAPGGTAAKACASGVPWARYASASAASLSAL